MGVKQFCLDIFARGVIQVALALHGPIGHPTPALEHIEDLIQEFFKGHRHPSACGLCAPRKVPVVFQNCCY
jgi:hypothetical protein